jgi:elongation factor Tu
MAQAKAKFFRTKRHVNVAMLGHIDHGKMLLSAITKVLSLQGLANYVPVDQINKAPEEKAKGITIAGPHVEFETQKRHYAASYFSRHTDVVKGLISGAADADGAVVVISAADGPTSQTREHVRLARLLNVPSIIVFVNTEDRVDAPRQPDSVELEMRTLLSQYGFPGEKIPIIRGSALKSLQSEGTGPDAERIMELLHALDAHVPTPVRAVERPFLMPVEDVFTIAGRGTVATGRVERGVVKVGDTVEIVGFRATQQTVVTGIKMFRKVLDRGEAGDIIEVLLRGVKRNEIKRGQVLAKPGSITPHTRFAAEVYVLSKDEGGRHTPFFQGYRPQFYFRTTDVTGVVTLPAGTEMVMPGDNVAVQVELSTPIALEKQLRFAMREGGGTVGVGIISEVSTRANLR